MIEILEEHQVGLGVAELCCKYGISDATFYKWRSMYGALKKEKLTPRKRGGHKRDVTRTFRDLPAWSLQNRPRAP